MMEIFFRRNHYDTRDSFTPEWLIQLKIHSGKLASIFKYIYIFAVNKLFYFGIKLLKFHKLKMNEKCMSLDVYRHAVQASDIDNYYE